MENDKELLRTWLKTKRLALEPAEVKRLSSRICEKLIKNINWQNIKSVHCYQSIDSLKEVNTAPILSFLRSKHPQVEVTIQSQTSDLPVEKQYDLIVVPVLGFDNQNYRLGMGGGFYDRFLARQPKALKVGLAYEAGRLKKLPREKHDIKLDKVVTEI